MNPSRPGDLLNALDASLMTRLLAWLAAPVRDQRYETQRFDEWMTLLERDIVERDAFFTYLGSVVGRTDAISLFAEAGISTDEGFLQGLIRRISYRVLPRSFRRDRLRDWMNNAFASPEVAQWLAHVQPDQWRRLERVIGIEEFSPQVREHLAAQLLDSIQVMSARIAAIGVHPLMRQHRVDGRRSMSPFLEQQSHLSRYVADWRAAGTHRDKDETRLVREDDREVRVLLDQCLDVTQRIRRSTTQTGVTFQLASMLQQVEQMIPRLEQMLDMMDWTRPDAELSELRRTFFRQQVQSAAQEASLRDHWQGRARLVAREITEQAGRGGDHYIASTSAEWWAILSAAVIGGVLIAVMGFIKIQIGQFRLPQLTQGLLIMANYAFWFVVIQLLHGTVATKQPSVTAARLVSVIDRTRDRKRMDSALVGTMIDVVRGQAAAVLGNLVLAIPVAAMLTWTLHSFRGFPPVSHGEAHHLLEELNPFISGTIWYAALTGVLLFMAGIAAGYADNLFVFHRVPERMTRSRSLNRRLGARRTSRFASFVDQQGGTTIGSITLGILLGGTTLLGTLTGLPLDTRHVAISSAKLAVGASAIWPDVSSAEVWLASIGLGVTGALNLVVSFTLTMTLALAARGMPTRRALNLSRSLLRSALRRPHDILLPWRTTRGDAAHSPETTRSGHSGTTQTRGAKPAQDR